MERLPPVVSDPPGAADADFPDNEIAAGRFPAVIPHAVVNDQPRLAHVSDEMLRDAGDKNSSTNSTSR